MAIEDLASYFHRQTFINLIKEMEQDASYSGRFRNAISNPLKVDDTKNLSEWENKLKSSDY